jgi:ABC-2 type transport system ATP-binding protein
MDAGRIVAQGSPEELKASIGTDVVTVRPRGGEQARERTASILGQIEDAEVRRVDETVMVYVAEGAKAIPRIVLALSEADVEVAEITLARPTLDDVFLRKTGHHIEVGLERPEGRP